MRTILLVEDNVSDAKLTMHLLNDCKGLDPKVTHVPDLSTALARLERGAYDVVLLDLSLPDSSRLQGLQRLRSTTPHVPIVVLSGQQDQELALEAVQSGAQDYLLKNVVSPEVLTRVLNYSIERHASEERFRSLVANIPGAVYRCRSDQAWTMTFLTDPFQAMTGWSCAEFIAENQGYLQLIHTDDQERTARLVMEAMGRNEAYAVEYRLINRRGETRHILDRGQAVGGGGADSLRDGVLFDMTDAKEAESQVSKLENQIRRTRQSEAMGHLAGGIAHEFRNFLTAINGFAELMQDHVKTNDAAQRSLIEIRKTGGKAAALTEQLLTLGTRKQSGATGLIDMMLLLNESDRVIRWIAGPDRQIQLALDPQSGRIKANPQEIEQVLYMAVMNLCGTSEPGDTIRLATSLVEIDAAQAGALSLAQPGTYLTLTVRKGSLKEAETSEVVPLADFIINNNEHEIPSGELTMRRVLTELGGLYHASQDSDGAFVFRFIIPQARIVIEPTQPSTPFHASLPQPHMVLVVEDDDNVRNIVCQTLKNHGYLVREAASGAQARGVIHGSSDPIHVLLTDEKMPDLTGQELARELRETRPELKVMLMTGGELATDVRLFDQGQPTVVLEKPFGPPKLIKEMAALIGTPSPPPVESSTDRRAA